MIEFKAECGHTVRARDEDAGLTVRCAYCGRSAQVPEGEDKNLDLLLQEGDLTAKPPLHVPAPRRSRFGRLFRRTGGTSGGFDPWPVIMRMIYFAILVSVVIVVTNMFILPQFDSFRKRQRAATATSSGTEAASTRRPRPPDDSVEAGSGRGFVHRDLLSGLVILSTPTGVPAFVAPSDQAPTVGRIHRANGVIAGRTGSSLPRVGDGSYVVEVAVPWNDPTLKRYVGYTEFRREVEKASQNQRRLLVEDYFVHDEASAVFFDDTEDQKFLVRQYRNVEVRNGRSAGVRAVFLPRIPQGDGPGFAIEPLVVNYLPDAINFVFDERDVLDELGYYEVKAEDRPWVVKGLARIGIMPYITAGRRVIVFKIGLEDGVLVARVLRETGR